MRRSGRVPGSRPDPLAALVIGLIVALSLTLAAQVNAGKDSGSVRIDAMPQGVASTNIVSVDPDPGG